jgi:7-keto-8-aminopelargonate synthetase-like enzyme
VRAKFYYFAVIVSAGVDEDGLRFGGAKSFVEIGVIERQVEMEFCGVLIEESAVRFGDGYDLNVGAIPEMGEEAVSVTVDQAGDDYAERRFGVGGG